MAATCVPCPSSSMQSRSVLDVQSLNKRFPNRPTSVTRPFNSSCVGLTPVSSTQIRIPLPVVKALLMPTRSKFHCGGTFEAARSASGCVGISSSISESSSAKSISVRASTNFTTSASVQLADKRLKSLSSSQSHLVSLHSSAPVVSGTLSIKLKSQTRGASGSAALELLPSHLKIDRCRRGVARRRNGSCPTRQGGNTSNNSSNPLAMP
mmetsp:Transcript_39008/g.112026  ORF Transcript_39008/g.112026 Transcript_39008/m.112026 type:complete len:209 (-) Transcript_39008:56-682(-)